MEGWRLACYGRSARSIGSFQNGRKRRISFVPVRLNEGPLTKPTPAAQPSRRERVFVPHPVIAGERE